MKVVRRFKILIMDGVITLLAIVAALMVHDLITHKGEFFFGWLKDKNKKNNE